MVTRSILVLVLVAALGGSALADDLAQAREHYRRGTIAYDLQQYLEAAREYEAAFRLHDDPAILFNLGQAYRLGGDYERSVGAYRSYLRRLPDADNRAAVLARVSELSALVERQRQARAAPPSDTLPAPPGAVVVTAAAPPRTDHRARQLRLAGIGTSSAGLALVVGGIAAAVVAKQGSDAITSADHAHGVYSPSDYTRYHDGQIAAGVLLGVGGAALVGGVVLYLVGHRQGARLHAFGAPSFGSAGL